MVWPWRILGGVLLLGSWISFWWLGKVESKRAMEMRVRELEHGLELAKKTIARLEGDVLHLSNRLRGTKFSSETVFPDRGK